MREITREEICQLEALLIEHDLHSLISRLKPSQLEVEFDFRWLGSSVLARSPFRNRTAGPYFIELSPLLLDWGFTDRGMFLAVVLHELAHVLDTYKNWGRHISVGDLADREILEFEADNFVVEKGFTSGLLEALKLTVARYREHGLVSEMTDKRLSRLLNLLETNDAVQ